MEDNTNDSGGKLTRLPRRKLTGAQSLEKTEPRVLVTVSPFRCRVWDMHDRLEDYITPESCCNEIDSFEAHGQLVPALGRPLWGDPDYDIEVICGARRLFVARHLGALLQIELREMSDKDALIALDIENRHRKDTSPYERGVTYQRWLRAGLFASQEELAHTLNISPSQVSRLLRLTQLPAVLVNAFASPLDLREGWGLELYNTWQDPRMRSLMAHRARELAEQTPRPNALEIYRRLIAAPGSSLKLKIRHRDEVVRGPSGTALFRIRRRPRAVTFVIPSSISPDLLEEARDVLSSILRNRGEQSAEPDAGLQTMLPEKL